MEEVKQHLYDSDSEESGMLAMPVAGESLRHRFSWWRRRRNSGSKSDIWKWMTVLWIAVSIILASILVWPRNNEYGTYETGFTTDMRESRASVEGSVAERGLLVKHLITRLPWYSSARMGDCACILTSPRTLPIQTSKLNGQRTWHTSATLAKRKTRIGQS